MRPLFIVCFLVLDLLASDSVSIQSNEMRNLQTMVRGLSASAKKLQRDQFQLRQQLKAQGRRLDTLSRSTTENRIRIGRTTDDVTSSLEKTGKTNEARFAELGGLVSKSRIQWIVGTLAVCALSAVGFILVRRRLSSSKREIEQTIAATRKSLEEESVKLDSKLAEVLGSQLQLQKALPQDSNRDVAGKPYGHTLALRVADEVVRMRRNIALMDPNTRGIKQLSGSVTRLQDNLHSLGYETPNMLNKKYDEGMKVAANFVPDASLRLGDQIITRIIKPQVNYKGVMIQSAQVEVSIPAQQP